MHDTLQNIRDKMNLILDYIDMSNDSNYHSMHDKIAQAILDAKILLEDAEHECKNC